MNAVVAPEFLPTPLNTDKSALLARLVEGLQPAELYWVAAWSASLAAQAPSQSSAPLAVPSPVKAVGERLTIVYGSQTGNAKRIAEQLAERSEAAGLPVRLVRANAYPHRELAQERYLAVVISTQGEGEPPDDARGFVEFIAGKRAPKLPSLQFAVLGLGDSSYPQFCVIGRQLDARLAELGGARFAPFGETDVDVEAVAKPWLDKTLEQARDVLKSIAPAARISPLHAVSNRSTYSRERPFAATVLANQRIVARDNARDVRHVELSLAGSGLQYAPGDALGIWPSNPSVLVEQWLAALQLDGALDVTHEARTLTLTQWLTREREITRLNRSFVATLAATSGHAELIRVLQVENAADFSALLASDQPIDLLRRYPAIWKPEALVAALRPLTPRLYSIASSPQLVGDEVHLTVAVVDYEAHGSPHFGAASAFLAATDEDGKVPVFIESNERFHLPADSTRDIIMIGPGTGVAPFRAFVQERQESGASGRNWLFFGNRHFAQDFLYQVEWQEALKQGALHRLDLAFSRDQSSKTYVQDRLREQGAELYAWLQNGAHLYVCGDSAHMAKDVHAALIEVITIHGKQSPDDAKAWLNELLQQGRYARDVY
ncbi:assimilatory sulfite reductase (NADPH) flavoprotein subunit [Rhodanobacter sp. MP7CTX1]|uniref:assimilatory sulfite reductase (NADPH) flavoprotein subunit n=1 Tax=Rhodanobacter sp. MP7CTX1 TaxID=2723084 RepID=UPI001612BD97|nr:sulfite reductase (NADPH) flavoprotein alpha-component [Rhodanobacter sp. MP7CTX1]